MFLERLRALWTTPVRTTKTAGSAGETSPVGESQPAPNSEESISWRRGDIHESEIHVGPLTVTATIEMSARGFVAVVGESHYQEALITAKRSKPAEDEPVFLATLIAEPTNPYDPNAVVISIEPFGKIGHLQREIAKRYSPLLIAAGGTAQCPAQLRGGTAEKPSIGVVLDAARVNGPALLNYDVAQPLDYPAIEQYHTLRNANQRFVLETKPVESNDLETAIRRYRRALAAMGQYERLAAEKKLFPQLAAHSGDVSILNRLTLCLIKAGRSTEAIEEADRYFANFPDALHLKSGQAVKARVDKRRVSS
jgi:hypothetical protein